MDFFEAQALAKQRTTRLIALFALAVLGTIAAGYFAFIVLTAYFGVRATANGGGLERDLGGLDHLQLWQPGALISFTLLTLGVVGLSALGKWLQLRAGGRAVAALVGARELAPQTTDLRERQLLNVVEEMSIASGLPLPADHETGINAFAAGLTTSDAVVTVTRGTLENLTRDELQGVVAHEFSHILNGDMRLNVRLTAILHGILVVGLIGRGILSGMGNMRVRSSDRDKNGGGLIIVIFAVGLVMIALGYVGYFFGRLIQAAVSRQREFLADAAAVQFTRNPSGICGALKKIGGYSLGSRVQATKASEFSHFFFAQGFLTSFGGLWATHPPIGERIRAIDPAFDGHYPPHSDETEAAPETVRQAASAFSPARSQTTGGRALKKTRSSDGIDPQKLVAAIGSLNPDHTALAQLLAQSLPSDLRTAARTPATAAALVCGLLLPIDASSLRTRQLDLIRRIAGSACVDLVTSFETNLRSLPHESRLPLLLLTPPALRKLPPADLARLLETLDELVHADQQVSLFEFALQKVLAHHLALAAKPSGRREIYSPADVSNEISVVLSFGCRLSLAPDADAENAFNAGATIFSGIFPVLRLIPAKDCTLAHLDLALDRLALTYGPVKKRLLTALAITISHDGTIDPDEADLLRALSSALDCPMPLASV
jgi:Zn-dependent protease with chaperone function